MIPRAPVAIFIITKNEEKNLPHALASVRDWAREIFVLDSGSTDKTREVAESMGAHFSFRPWDGYVNQKNWGLANLPITAPWVFILDADEAITPELRDEVIRVATENSCAENGFYINRHLLFMGRRICHCGYYPNWNLRFFRHGKARYEQRSVHEHMIVDGPVGRLQGEMEHYDRRGIEYYVAKHNAYSTLEAREIYNLLRGQTTAAIGSLRGDAVMRRRWLKNRIWPHLPAKWLVRWFYMYVLKLGFLDGRAGFQFCLFIASYEHQISLKLRELFRNPPASDVPPVVEIDVPPEEKPVARSQQPEDAVGSALADAPIQHSAFSTQHSPQSSVLSPQSSPQHSALSTQHSLPIVQRFDQAERFPYQIREYAMRVMWELTRSTLFRWSPRRAYGWRNLLLRLFGAKIAPHAKVRATARVFHPWLLEMADWSVIGDDAEVYNLGPISIGAHSMVSQRTHLCAGTHDYRLPHLPLLRPPIRIGSGVWICADAFVGPGVTVADNSVVGARAVVTKDVPPNMVVAGNPARVVKTRVMRDQAPPSGQAVSDVTTKAARGDGQAVSGALPSCDPQSIHQRVEENADWEGKTIEADATISD